MTVKDKDNGIDDLIKNLSNGIEMRIGVQGTEASAAHAGAENTVADIASKHEFGIGVPQRSFIRDWFDQERKQIRQTIHIIPRIMKSGKKSLNQALDQVGEKLVASIKKRIVAHIPPPLSDVTVDLKGSSTPLVNTGQLISSITHVHKIKRGK